jgi:hypothetical protein
MRIGLFGSVEAAGEGFGRGFHNYVDCNVEAEALGYTGITFAAAASATNASNCATAFSKKRVG